MINGRKRIQQACDSVNALKLLPFPIQVPGIDTAEGEALKKLISIFMDSIELIPASKEKLLPDSVKILYNAIADNSITFDKVSVNNTSTQAPVQDCAIVIQTQMHFERTVFTNDTGTETTEAHPSS